MSTTLTRHEIKPGRANAELRLDPLDRRRRPALAAGSLALVVACIAVFVGVYVKAGDRVSVLAVARAVPQGQPLQPDDLSIVRVSTSAGVTTVPAAEASAVLGRRAAERLDPGTLLNPTELVTSYAPPAGDSIVGVAVKEGQLPASGVSPGETVEIVLTGLPGEQVASSTTTDDSSGAPSAAGGTTASDGQPGDAGTVLVPAAVVLDEEPSPSSSGSDAVDVSLLMASPEAPAVASASAAGQAALIVVAPGS